MNIEDITDKATYRKYMEKMRDETRKRISWMEDRAYKQILEISKKEKEKKK